MKIAVFTACTPNLHLGLVEASLRASTQVLLPRHTAVCVRDEPDGRWSRPPPPHTFAEGTLCVHPNLTALITE